METSKKVELFRQTHTLVKIIRRRSMKKMDIYKSGDFYPSDFRVLSVLDEKEGKSIGDITKRWNMHYSNVTSSVNLLVSKGYAMKKKSETDRRKTMVYITAEGIRVKDMIFDEYDSKISELLADVDDEKIVTALEAINLVLGQMQEKK